ncbi:unnamed protein product [marine sediment metagenome]|uniref:Uncharacterized protein n=1 Tax=marine sediment metagenome TaxID=412755 RepID=X1AGQ6_9ZZZZ
MMIDTVEGYDDAPVRIVTVMSLREAKYSTPKREKVLAVYIDREMADELKTTKGWQFTWLDTKKEVSVEMWKALLEEMGKHHFSR